MSLSRDRDYLKLAVENKIMDCRYFIVAKGNTARKTAYFKVIK